MLGLKLSHEGQDNFNILTICFKQKEGGISSHTLKCGVSIPKNSDEPNLYRSYPATWGLVDWVDRRNPRRELSRKNA